MKKLTLAELKRRKTVKVKRTMESISVDEMREKLLNWLKSHDLPIDKLQENENQFSYEGNFWLKPRGNDYLEGTITFRSKDYYFTYMKDGKEVNSYGEIKAENLTDNGFFINTFRGEKIIYEILD